MLFFLVNINKGKLIVVLLKHCSTINFNNNYMTELEKIKSKRKLNEKIDIILLILTFIITIIVLLQ